MKTIITALALCFTISASAHHIENLCWSNNRFKIVGKEFPTTGKVRYRVYTDAAHTNLILDTTFASTATWNASVPQALSTQPVYIMAYYKNTNGAVSLSNPDWARNYSTSTDKCASVLPLSWRKVDVDKISINEVKVSITVYDVSNVKAIDFQMRKIGSEDGYKTVTVVLPANVQENRTYSAIIKIN